MYKYALNNVSILALTTALVGSMAVAQQTVDMPVLPNTEPETGPVNNASGFVLSLDGVPVNADPQIEDQVRQTDIALANADVQIQMDANDPIPLLDVEVAGAPRAYKAGEQILLLSETNYPAFIARAEMRVIDRGAPGGDRLLATVPVTPNGQASIIVPEGRDIVVVHRVYDQRGRYDETRALPLGMPDARGQIDDVEEGSRYIANRNIPLNAGATVTVSATDVAPGAVLETLGERVRPDANGRLVIDRILPPGDHVVEVNVSGGGQNLDLARPVQVDGSDWFYVFVADLTYGRFEDEGTNNTETRTSGRIQFYVEGETENGVMVTSSLDTGEQQLDEIFTRLDERNPDDILDRIDPNSGYPTYGDDSTIVDNTPTSGRIYLRVERDNNFGLWGDYQAQLAGNGYVRNERSLYGAQGHLESDATTERGDVRTTFDAYAAQPEQAIGRDVFQGTGGSVYFLSAQDIERGTQTVTLEVRDSATNRVVDRVLLIEGRDYQINALQGVITLNEPLTGTIDRRVISSNLSGDETVNLIAQYEYTPTASDIDGFSYGARLETWLTDDLRVGLSGVSDDDGVNEQRNVGVDLRYELGDNSFVQLDYAESDGSGFDQTVSTNGGLVFDTETGAGGTGEAAKLEAQFDFADLGLSGDGLVGGYFETRTEGFTTLDYRVDATTGDETLFGVFAVIEPEEGRFAYSVYADVYENDVGDDRLEVGAEVSVDVNERFGLVAAIEHLNETDIAAATSGTRTDLAVELTYALNDSVDVFAFGQGSLQNNGLERNDRYGLGLAAGLGNGWNVGAEVSDGHGGLGAELFAVQTRDDNSSVYFGYDLDPSRTLAGISSGFGKDDNGGRYVMGATRHINEEVAYFTESTYDIFGNSKELISAYGVTYTPRDFISYTVTYDNGRLNEADGFDVERQALSFGVRYEDSDTRASGRIEVRHDEFEDPAEQNTLSYFAVADAEYTISEESRLLASVDFADTEANGVTFQTGRYADVVLGYAHRPIDNERLNVLASYRYFYDNLGQEIDGVFGDGPVQESHVVSLEGNYDLNPNWTLGAKIGGRWAQTAAAAGDPFASNDALLGVLNARYHLVHNWDVLLEARHLNLLDAGTSETGLLGAAYYQVNTNASVGVGYNFASFSDDLTDLTFDDSGVFINLIAKY